MPRAMAEMGFAEIGDLVNCHRNSQNIVDFVQKFFADT
jgi:hypothetical protein